MDWITTCNNTVFAQNHVKMKSTFAVEGEITDCVTHVPDVVEYQSIFITNLKFGSL